MSKNYNLTNQEIQNTFEQLAQVSSSIENGVSGYAVTDGTGSKVDLLNVSASYALTASFAQNAAGSDTGSLLVTSSAVNDTITFTKGDGSTYTNTINNVSSSLSSSYATFAQNADEANDLVITVKNVSGGTLAIGTAVHPVGVSGENIEVVTASADQPSNMPAVAVLSQEISNNASGTAIINGRLTGINTANLVAGAPVYVNNGGLLTATKPTGSSLIQNIGTAAKINASEGEVVLQGSGRSNDVPNISTGYLWVGNNDQVATPTLSSSIVVDNANTASYVAGANVDGAVANATNAVNATNADNIALTADNVNTNRYVPFTATANGDGALLTDAGLLYNAFSNTLTATTFNGNATSASYALSASYAVSASHEIITEISSSHAVQADSASYVNTLNQSVIISGSRVDIEGTNSNEGLYVEGGSVNVNAKGTKQFGNMRMYYDTDKWSGNFNGYQLINNSSGSEAFTGLMGVSTFTGYDGTNPVFYLQGGGNNGTYQNTILRTSYNKPWVNITKQASFDQPITASADVDINGDLTVSGSNVKNITLGDPLNNNNGIFITSSGTNLVKGSTDFTNGAFYFGDQINIGSAMNFQGAGSSLNVADGTTVDFDTDVKITGSLDVSGSANITGSANIVGTTFTSTGVVSPGVLDIGSTSNPVQFPNNRIYFDTAGFGSGYAAYQLIDQGSTVDSQFEVSTFTGLDGSNPVARLRMGAPINGDNTVIWSGVTDNYAHFKKQMVFDAPVTASAQISASAGIIVGEITGSVDVAGGVTANAGNVTVYNSNNSAVAVGDASNPQQFAQMRIYNNIDTYDGSLYNAFNLIDEGSATDSWDAGMEVTTFASAYDGNNKVFRIGGGGITGPNGGYTNNQYILTATTTGGKVYMHKDTEFESNVKFDNPVTSSADVMVSASKVLELQPVGTLNATAPTGSLQVSSSGEIFLWTGGAGGASGVPGWGKLTVTN